MIRFLFALFLICGLGLAGSVRAQTAPESASGNIQSAQRTIKEVQRSLSDRNLSDAGLQNLRGQLDPAIAAAQQALDQETQRLEAVKARLAQLGPRPAANAAPEPASVSQTRDEQTKFANRINGELSQAKLALVDAGQLQDRISARRRDLFVNNVFARTYSIFSPSLWSEVVQETPPDGALVYYAWTHWTSAAASRLDGWTWVVFLGALAGIALLYGACAAIVRRILSRDPKTAEPTRLKRGLAAVWVAFLTGLAPILGVTAVALALRGFGLADTTADPFLRTTVFAVVRISLTVAIGRGLLAPSRPKWRLLEMSTPHCESLLRLAVAVAFLISLGDMLNSLADQVAFSLPMSVAIRSLTALAVAFIMAASLRGILADQDDAEDSLGPRMRPGAEWRMAIRSAAWAAIVALALAVSIGYVAFAAFLLKQIVWVALVGACLYLALTLANEGISATFRPNGRIERGFVASLGIRRNSLRQFAILVSGLASLALWAIAVLLVLAPWGVESSDMLSGLRAAFFGFRVGGLAISLSAIALAIVLLMVGLLATRWVQRWFDTRLLPATELDIGLRNSIRTSVGYLGVIASVVVALSQLGVDLQKIAIVAGALSVGIGFGLQSIVNNFVSGLIILWERAIRVGDLITVGDEQGHVKRISVRATEIETSDRVTMIVPNSNLVTGVVKNWVRGDRMARIKINLTLGAPADPELAGEVLTACARDNPSVVKLPQPQALLTSIDGGALKFELVCFVDDVETAGRVRSDLHFELFRRLKAAGLEAPSAPAPTPTPVTVQFTGLERLLEQAAGAKPE